MAEELIQQKIETRLAELPENVREAVLSADLSTHVHDIGSRHNLHVDQIGKLEDEVMLVMLGFFEPEAFSAQLEQQLLIPAVDANAIAGEVSAEIFMPIRESLKKFMDEKRRGATQTPASTPAPVFTPASQPITPPTPIKINIAVSTPPVIQPLAPSIPTAPTPAPAAPVVPIAPIMPKVEAALTQPTITVPTPPASQPTPNAQSGYKTDPYREPVE